MTKRCLALALVSSATSQPGADRVMNLLRQGVGGRVLGSLGRGGFNVGDHEGQLAQLLVVPPPPGPRLGAPQSCPRDQAGQEGPQLLGSLLGRLAHPARLFEPACGDRLGHSRSLGKVWSLGATPLTTG